MRTIHKQFEQLEPGDKLEIIDHRGNRIVITGPVKKLSPTGVIPAMILAALSGGLIVGILAGILAGILSLFN